MRLLSLRPRSLLLVACGVLLLTSGCAGATHASKRYAKPWSSSLAPLFDDATDVCAPWASSTEPWARREHELMSKRCQQADIIAVGLIEEVVDTLSGGRLKQMVLHFRVDRLIRGTVADLPAGKRRVSLVVSKKEDVTIPKKMLRKPAVLALRWLKGENPPFRWHVTCLSIGVQTLVDKHIKERRRQEGGGSSD